MTPIPKEMDAASLDSHESLEQGKQEVSMTPTLKESADAASIESPESYKQEKDMLSPIRKSPRLRMSLPMKKPTEEVKSAAKKPETKKQEAKKRKASKEELCKAKERKKKTIEKRHKRLEARKKKIQESKSNKNPLLIKSLNDINFYKLLLMSSSPFDIMMWLKKCHEEAPLNGMALGYCRWARFCSMGKAKHWRPAAIHVLKSRFADSFPKPGDGCKDDDLKQIMALMEMNMKVQGLLCITEEQEPRNPFA